MNFLQDRDNQALRFFPRPYRAITADYDEKNDRDSAMFKLGFNRGVFTSVVIYDLTNSMEIADSILLDVIQSGQIQDPLILDRAIEARKKLQGAAYKWVELKQSLIES